MKKILIQLDTDTHPSSFDRVVAIDAGVDVLFSYGGVNAENVEPLVHGAMFTRGPGDLKHTAFFVGGSDVTAGEELLSRVTKTFFGPIRNSVMMDSNGSNTTAAAAVLAAQKHIDLSQVTATVLGGTGPVGHRVAQLLASLDASVRVGSRSMQRAKDVCQAVESSVKTGSLTAAQTATESEILEACRGSQLIVAAGAAGCELIPEELVKELNELRVAVDLNAVPPAGIAGVELTDKGTERDGVVCHGALGVGGMKMKIHKLALQRLFDSNDHILDTAAIFEIGQQIQ